MLIEIDQKQHQYDREFLMNSERKEKRSFFFSRTAHGRKATTTPFLTQLNYLLRFCLFINANIVVSNIKSRNISPKNSQKKQKKNRRTFLSSIRDPGVFWIRFLLFAFISLFIGTLFLQMGEHDQDTIRDRLVSLYFPICFLCFMSVGALPAFLIEVFSH